MAGNPAKLKSKTNGTSFLRAAFSAEEEVLALQVALSSKSITHSGSAGAVNERHFIDFLRRYLPGRYEIDSAIVIDSNGKSSDQIDVVIFDNQYTPTLLDQKSHRFVPAEAVYAVLEIKPTINGTYLKYAADKAMSVRQLHRTSVPIKHSDGERPAKELFPIIAGIVAPSISYKDGFDSAAFRRVLSAQTDIQGLDCGLALDVAAYDSYSGSIATRSGANCLIYFVFRLLGQLQSLGTVPAVDWNRYAAVLSANRA